MPELDGKVAIVTGANSGLGEQTASMLATQGATVVMACRNQDKAHAAANRIALRIRRPPPDIVGLDLGDLASVRACADLIAAKYEQVDILVNNAGLMAVNEGRTTDGFEVHMGVNHLGHFALTVGLLPVVTATPGARVVTVTSIGHWAGRLDLADLMFERRPYSRWSAYFQSKLANLLFVSELDRRLRATASTCLALAAHPGWGNTDLGAEGSGLLNRSTKWLMPLFGQSPRRGALPTLRAATDPSARGGQLYGPHLVGWGHPVIATASPASRDIANAAELWRLSEQLTGVASAFGGPASAS